MGPDYSCQFYDRYVVGETWVLVFPNFIRVFKKGKHKGTFGHHDWNMVKRRFLKQKKDT